jgi:hypothetical protein
LRSEQYIRLLAHPLQATCEVNGQQVAISNCVAHALHSENPGIFTTAIPVSPVLPGADGKSTELQGPMCLIQ